jgi:ankyrin repeat protein
VHASLDTYASSSSSYPHRSVKRLLCDSGRPNGATFSRSQSAALLRDFRKLRAQMAQLNVSSSSDSKSNEDGGGRGGGEIIPLTGSFDTAAPSAAPSTPTAAHSRAPRKLSASDFSATIKEPKSGESVQGGAVNGGSYSGSSEEKSPFSLPGADSDSASSSASSSSSNDTGNTSSRPPPLKLASPLDWTGTNGRTALMEAAHEGRDEALAWLLAAGATPSIRTPKGMTALHYAAKQVRADDVILVVFCDITRLEHTIRFGDLHFLKLYLID